MNRICRIYTLAHPITGEIRYVGKTIRTLTHRFDRHISDSKKGTNRNYRWIQSLAKQGLKPIIELLDEIDESESAQVETYWIAQFRAWGFRLNNHTDGGEGMIGFKHSEESLIKMRNKVMSEESKKKMSDFRVGKYLSDSVKKNLSLVHKGRILSEETKLKMSSAKRRDRKNTEVVNILTNEVFLTVASAARSINIVPQTLNHRIKKGIGEFKIRNKE